MSKTVHISSKAQFDGLLKSSTVVVTDFYADWCGPCKAIAPVYEQLSSQLSRPNRVTFTKVNVDQQRDVASTYGITAMPTFMIFKNGQTIETVRGADPRKLSHLVRKLAAEADGGGSGGFASSSASSDQWLGLSLPRGYGDVTDQIDIRGLDLLNADGAFGDVRTLFQSREPSALPQKSKSKQKAPADASSDAAKDWIESDSDEQLMLYVPFQATLKVHTLFLTALPPPPAESDSEPTSRPRTVRIYANNTHTPSFDEAESLQPTHEVTLSPQDWADTNSTARVELRFVKFQHVTSLVIFVVDGEEGAERTRLDRIRIIGEAGEKREMGKLEKIGDQAGE